MIKRANQPEELPTEVLKKAARKKVYKVSPNAPSQIAAANRRYRYAPVDRQAVLIVLDFLNGDIERTSEMLGVTWSTVRGYANGRDRYRPDKPVYKNEFDELHSHNVLIRLGDKLATALVQRFPYMTPTEMTQTLDVLFDKLILIQKNSSAMRQSAKETAKAGREVVAQKEVEESAPDPVNEAEKQRWDGVVLEVMTEAAKRGDPITREEAIIGIVNSNPNAAPFLLVPDIDGEYSN